MVALARIRSGERILDVGCGPGRLAFVAATAAGPEGEVRGIDPAPEMVELARRTAAQAGVTAHFEVGVIEALPYPPDHIDVVLSSLMLHHLPDPVKRRGLAEMLDAKGLTWRQYAEAYPGACTRQVSAAGNRYVRKHVPFLTGFGDGSRFPVSS
jgi:2-polyprenyl-3-methyl-5-hydroxy-6-metoxy-1,4-benzoquinol methylase